MSNMPPTFLQSTQPNYSFDPSFQSPSQQQQLDVQTAATPINSNSNNLMVNSSNTQQYISPVTSLFSGTSPQHGSPNSVSTNFKQSLKEKSQLWMGELDPWWDENTIRSIWASLGETVTNVKLIKEKSQMDSSSTIPNAGYCFVDFATFANASKAILKNGLLIPGTNRTLKLNWASGGNNNTSTNAYHNPMQQQQVASNHHDLSIFVGDLAGDIKEHDLFEYFKSRYPSTVNVKIMIDPVSMVSKGYGFVKFANQLEMHQALMEMNGLVLNGRPIRVSTASPKTNNNYTHNHNNNNAMSNSLMQTSQFQPPLSQHSDPNNTTVFVGGLSAGVNEQQLRSYFQSFGDIIYVKVLSNKGCGFVQYVLRGSAENAIQQMQGYPIGNLRIRLSWGRSSLQNIQNQQKYYQQQMAAVNTNNLIVNSATSAAPSFITSPFDITTSTTTTTTPTSESTSSSFLGAPVNINNKYGLLSVNNNANNSVAFSNPSLLQHQLLGGYPNDNSYNNSMMMPTSSSNGSGFTTVDAIENNGNGENNGFIYA